MKRRESSLQSIYSSLICEAMLHLEAVEEFLSFFFVNTKKSYLDASILQLRKALESIAISAIAPDKNQYDALRLTYTKNSDFTKDYHASKIFDALQRINPDFYPLPLTPAEPQPDGHWHYGKKESGFLSQKRFERTYDRLGKYLHAKNPWGTEDNLQNLINDIPFIVRDTRGLIDLHARFIRTTDFKGVWFVKASSTTPQIFPATANGPFIVNRD